MGKKKKIARYKPDVFTVESVQQAKGIILTPENSTTDARWQQETPYLVDKMGEFFQPGSSTLLLDYGCGIGRVARELIKRYGCKIIGVDISASMRQLALQYVQSPSFVVYSPKEFAAWVESGNKVDAAFAVWVLQHSNDVVEDIDIIKSSLKTEGKFFVLNNRRMAIPTDQGWVDNGTDVLSLLKSAFFMDKEFFPPPGILGVDLSQNTFIACLINKKSDESMNPHNINVADLAGLKKNAIALHKDKKHAEAIRLYRLYLQLVPDDAGIWINLGAALRAEKHYLTSLGCYRRALDLSPDDAGVMSNMGNALKDLDRVEEAVEYQSRAYQREPDNRQYRLNFAVALREAKRFDEALIHLNALVEQEPENAGYQWERGLVHLYLGNFRQGWIDYEARWRTGDLPVLNFGCQKWQGEDLNNKKLLLVAEQGYGDTILAARFIAVIKQRYPDCSITLECKPELQVIFVALPLAGFIEAGSAQYETGEFDFYCPVMSLMGVLGIDETNIPLPAHITVSKTAKNKFKAIIGKENKKKLKIGIVWSGSVTFKDNAKRACTLEQFLSLAELPGVQLYSLQKGERENDLELLQAKPLIIDLSQHLENFGDTAAAVEALDVIVMTDSSVAHLAGSLNKPIINLQQYKSYWLYYPEVENTPWYPSMEIIRQQRPGDWRSVFEKLLPAIQKIQQKTT